MCVKNEYVIYVKWKILIIFNTLYNFESLTVDISDNIQKQTIHILPWCPVASTSSDTGTDLQNECSWKFSQLHYTYFFIMSKTEFSLPFLLLTADSVQFLSVLSSRFRQIFWFVDLKKTSCDLSFYILIDRSWRQLLQLLDAEFELKRTSTTRRCVVSF